MCHNYINLPTFIRNARESRIFKKIFIIIPLVRSLCNIALYLTLILLNFQPFFYDDSGGETSYGNEFGSLY